MEPRLDAPRDEDIPREPEERELPLLMAEGLLLPRLDDDRLLREDEERPKVEMELREEGAERPEFDRTLRDGGVERRGADTLLRPEEIERLGRLKVLLEEEVRGDEMEREVEDDPVERIAGARPVLGGGAANLEVFDVARGAVVVVRRERVDEAKVLGDDGLDIEERVRTEVLPVVVLGDVVTRVTRPVRDGSGPTRVGLEERPGVRLPLVVEGVLGAELSRMEVRESAGRRTAVVGVDEVLSDVLRDVERGAVRTLATLDVRDASDLREGMLEVRTLPRRTPETSPTVTGLREVDPVRIAASPPLVLVDVLLRVNRMGAELRASSLVNVALVLPRFTKRRVSVEERWARSRRVDVSLRAEARNPTERTDAPRISERVPVRPLRMVRVPSSLKARLP